MPRRVALAVSTALILVASSAAAASFRGKSVDGHWYAGDISHPDIGTFRNVAVRFEGDRVMIQFAGGGQINAHLDDEQISDPHEIPCRDYRRGIVWELSVHGLGR